MSVNVEVLLYFEHLVLLDRHMYSASLIYNLASKNGGFTDISFHCRHYQWVLAQLQIYMSLIERGKALAYYACGPL